MFKPGSKVVYPMHGLGVIRGIEEKEFYDGKKSYYIIDIFNSTMNIMIPTKKASKSNLRLINDSSSLQEIFSELKSDDSYSIEDVSQKERYSINMKKMKSGLLKDSIELVRDLTTLNGINKLNTNEMQMLTTTRKFVIDEISLIENLSEEQANDFLDANIS